MRKLIKSILTAVVCFLITFVSVPNTAGKVTKAETEKINLNIVFDEERSRHDEDEIWIYVCLNENPGVNSLNMELSYNSSVMMLASYTKGNALKNMQLDTPETKEPEGYAYTPFTFQYTSSNEKENDTTTGTLFLLRFKIKEKAKDSEYKVTFTNCSSTFYNKEDEKSEDYNVVKDTATIKVSDGKVQEFVINEVKNTNEGKLWIILVCVIAGLAVVLLCTFIFVKKFKNNHLENMTNKKKNNKKRPKNSRLKKK